MLPPGRAMLATNPASTGSISRSSRYSPRSVGEEAWRRQSPGTMSSHGGFTPSYPLGVTVARACKSDGVAVDGASKDSAWDRDFRN